MSDRYLPYLLPVRSIVFVIIFIAAAVLTGKDLDSISNIWSIVASAVNIVTILLLIIASRKSGGYKKLINYEKGKTSRGQVIRMIILILVASFGGMYIAGFICYGKIPYMSPMMIMPIPIVPAVINLLILPVSTALAEDALYLGCGTGHIRNRYIAVIVPAFFFALQHCFIPMLFDIRYMIYRFLSFLPLTVILCINYRKNRNPLPIMIGHSAVDLFAAGWILATSAVPGFYEKLCSM